LSHEPFLERPPLIVHYGAGYTVHHIHFSKLHHLHLALEECPAFQFLENTTTGAIQSLATKKDALCFEHLAILDSAFCRAYRVNRCVSSRIPDSCIGSRLPRLIQEAQSVIEDCYDRFAGCDSWAHELQCTLNPLFMHSNCQRSCGVCSMSSEELDQHTGNAAWVDVGGQPSSGGFASTRRWSLIICILLTCLIQTSLARRTCLLAASKLESKCAV